MLDTEAFREFKQGLTLLRDNYCDPGPAAYAESHGPGQEQSLLHVLPGRGAGEVGTEVGRGRAAVRRRRAHEAQSGATVPESCGGLRHRRPARTKRSTRLQAGLKFARRDVRLSIALNRLMHRREPVFSFLSNASIR